MLTLQEKEFSFLSDPPEVELQMFVNYHVGVRNQTWVLWKSLSSSSHSTAVASEKSFVAAFQNWGGSVCQWFNFGFKWEEVLGKAKKQRDVTRDEDEKNRRGRRGWAARGPREGGAHPEDPGSPHPALLC